jgi:Kef-type K+ transport system membrane component KefB
MPDISNEFVYVLLIFGLLVAPRALQRYLIPAPLSCFALGMAAALALGASTIDATLTLMATLGISSLFLFAGLEIDLPGLRRGLGPLIAHLAVRSLVVAGAAVLAMRFLAATWQVGVLLALALLTPSTGFILESLARLGLDEKERFWVTNKAIGGEMLALVALFAVLQSDSLNHLLWSSAALAGMIVLMPLLFIALGRLVVPYAPGSEFSLLVMVGLMAAYLTKQLGVYYLVGAFIAGLVARLLRERMPALASAENLHAVKLFASFFVPFYFFHNGMNVPSGAVQWEALVIGLVLTAVVLPVRVALVWVQRRFLVHEDGRSSLRVAVALAPTLIFTLVLAEILHERYGLSDVRYGGLLVYAALTTVLPTLVLARSFVLDVSASPAPVPAGGTSPSPEPD